MTSGHQHKTRTLWLCGILHAFTHLYQLALVPLYLMIQRDLKLESVEESTLLVSVMGVAYFLPSYPQGVLADRFSRKKLLALGLLLNGIGFVCLAFAPNYAMALVSVTLAGLGGSFYHTAATALIARLYPAKTGQALGLVAIGASAGFFLSPIYSGWRAQVTGNWRAPVLEMGVAGIIFTGIFYWLAEADAVAVMRHFVATNRTLTSPRPSGFPSPPRDGSPTLDVRSAQCGPLPSEGSGEGDGSTVREINPRTFSVTANPGPHGEKLFPTRALWFIFLFMCVTMSLRDFAGSGMSSLGSLFLQKAHGFNPQTTGLVLSGIYLASAVSSPLFGRLSDGGRVRWAVLLMGLASIIIAIFPFVPKAFMFPALSAYGFFFMATYPVTEAAVMESVPDAVRGRVFGVFLTCGGLVGNISHWAVGDMVRRLGVNATSPGAYEVIYFFLALTMLGSLISLPGLHAIRKREGIEPHIAGGLPDTPMPNPHSAIK